MPEITTMEPTEITELPVEEQVPNTQPTDMIPEGSITLPDNPSVDNTTTVAPEIDLASEDTVATFDFEGAANYASEMGVDYKSAIVQHLEQTSGHVYDFDKARKQGLNDSVIFEELLQHKYDVKASEVDNDFLRGTYKSLESMHIALADVTDWISEGVEKVTGYDFYDDQEHRDYVKQQQMQIQALKGAMQSDDFWSLGTAGEFTGDILTFMAGGATLKTLKGAKTLGTSVEKLEAFLQSKKGIALTGAFMSYAHARGEGNNQADAAVQGAIGGAIGAGMVGGLQVAGSVGSGLMTAWRDFTGKSIAPHIQLKVLTGLKDEYLNTPLLREEFGAFMTSFRNEVEEDAFASPAHLEGQALVHFLIGQESNVGSRLKGYMSGSMKATDQLYRDKAFRDQQLLELAGVVKVGEDGTVSHILDNTELYGTAGELEKAYHIVRANYNEFMKYIDNTPVKDISIPLGKEELDNIKEELKNATLSNITDKVVKISSMRDAMTTMSDISKLMYKKSTSGKARNVLEQIHAGIDKEIKDAYIRKYGKELGLQKHIEFTEQKLAWARMKTVEDSAIGSIMSRLYKNKLTGAKSGNKENLDWVTKQLENVHLDQYTMESMTALVGSKQVSKVFAHMVNGSLENGSIKSINKLLNMVETKSAPEEVKVFVDTLQKYKKLFNDDITAVFGKTLDSIGGSKSDVGNQIAALTVKPIINYLLVHIPGINRWEYARASIQEDFTKRVLMNPVVMKKINTAIEEMPSEVKRNMFEQIAYDPTMQDKVSRIASTTKDEADIFIATADGDVAAVGDNVAKSFGMESEKSLAQPARDDYGFDMSQYRTFKAADVSRSARQKINKTFGSHAEEALYKAKVQAEEIRHYSIQLELAKAQKEYMYGTLETRGLKGSMEQGRNLDDAILAKIAKDKTLNDGIRTIQNKIAAKQIQVATESFYAQVRFLARKTKSNIEKSYGMKLEDEYNQIVEQTIKNILRANRLGGK